MVEKDRLLKYLFVDDISNQEDASDISKNIIKKENLDLTVSSNNYIKNANDIIKNKYYEKYVNKWNKLLNYYIFLDLLSENKWVDRIINLDEFWTALNNIKSSDRNLIDNASMIFEKNYQERYKWKELPDFAEEYLDSALENI